MGIGEITCNSKNREKLLLWNETPRIVQIKNVNNICYEMKLHV